MAGGDRTQAHQSLIRFCTEYLQAQHAWVYKTSGGMLSRPGCPDILAGIKDSRTGLAVLLAIEVKTGSARLSKVQEAERERLEAVGAIYILCRRPEDLEQGLLAAGLCAPILVGRKR
jgi:hypothetical protein